MSGNFWGNVHGLEIFAVPENESNIIELAGMNTEYGDRRKFGYLLVPFFCPKERLKFARLVSRGLRSPV
jgi:hypothetical protein